MNTTRLDKLSNLKRVQQRGVAAVEFALLLIPLLMIVAGIIEFGRVFWYYDTLTKATRDGVRFMSTVSVEQLGSIANASIPVTCSGSYSRTPKSIVYCAAVAANLPEFEIGDIDVFCDNQSCINSIKPDYIMVSINRYPVPIGRWIPFVKSVNLTVPWLAELSPSTTMRYMCSSNKSC